MSGGVMFEFEFLLGPLTLRIAFASDVPKSERTSDVGCYLERAADSVEVGDQMPVGF